MSLRDFRNRFVPFATKQKALAFLNPILKCFSPKDAVQSRLKAALAGSKIEFLDLGGWMPVEGYLTIHLSSVEPYGVVLKPASTMGLAFDEHASRPVQKPRSLEQPALSLHFDILQGLPLENESMRGVNLSHFLEHFDLETGSKILRECHRVLRPGGILRVGCPDLRKYARAYLDDDEAFFRQMSSPTYCNYRNLPSHGAVFAGKAYDAHNGHKWFYDAATVVAMCGQIGFPKAVECGLHSGSLPRISDIEPAYRAVESFYVEAVR